MWGIEALKDCYDVSLITTGEVNLDRLNQYYGTNVQPHRITVLRVPLPSFILKMAGGDALRGALYGRFCRKVANQFDVLISTYNFCDFGVPAIHCLADFSWDEEIRVKLHGIPTGVRRLFHKYEIHRRVYLRLVDMVAGHSRRNVFAGKDYILANSKWSASIIQKKYGLGVGILYPPVFDNFPEVHPMAKELGFVCIGRISPEKRIERLLAILNEVRRRSHDIHLHVIGEADGATYGKKISRLGARQSDWVKLEGEKFGQEKVKLLTRHGFGIHACQGEAFGIGVVEMVKAGCIVFAPNKGGQAEIIDHPLLLYENTADAVEKIVAVLREPELQNELRGHLKKRGNEFSTNSFMQGLRISVEKFLENKSKQTRAD